MEKTCTTCKETKPLDEFRNRKASEDGKEYRCKDCRRAFDNATYKNDPVRRESIRRQMKERSIALKRFVRSYLESHPCVDCGQTDADILEFDHVRGKKSGNISQMIAGACTMQRLLDEMAKCEIRCCNCHRKKTIIQFGWYAFLVQ